MGTKYYIEGTNIKLRERKSNVWEQNIILRERKSNAWEQMHFMGTKSVYILLFPPRAPQRTGPFPMRFIPYNCLCSNSLISRFPWGDYGGKWVYEVRIYHYYGRFSCSHFSGGREKNTL